MSTDGEASQVIEAATAGQRRNSSVVNSLFYLQSAMTRLIDGLVGDYDSDCLAIITDSVQVCAYLVIGCTV